MLVTLQRSHGSRNNTCLHIKRLAAQISQHADSHQALTSIIVLWYTCKSFNSVSSEEFPLPHINLLPTVFATVTLLQSACHIQDNLANHFCSVEGSGDTLAVFINVNSISQLLQVFNRLLYFKSVSHWWLKSFLLPMLAKEVTKL